MKRVSLKRAQLEQTIATILGKTWPRFAGPRDLEEDVIDLETRYKQSHYDKNRANGRKCSRCGGLMGVHTGPLGEYICLDEGQR